MRATDCSYRHKVTVLGLLTIYSTVMLPSSKNSNVRKPKSTLNGQKVLGGFHARTSTRFLPHTNYGLGSDKQVQDVPLSPTKAAKRPRFATVEDDHSEPLSALNLEPELGEPPRRYQVCRL